MSDPGRPRPMPPTKGWTGEAVQGWEGFLFAELPWDELRRRGDRRSEIECIKSSRSRKALRIPPTELKKLGIDCGGRSAFAKQYLVNSLRRRWGNLLIGSKAEREFRLGHELIKIGLPTPRPLAWARRRAGTKGAGAGGGTPPAASYLLTQEWPNQGSVKDWLGRSPGNSRDLAEALGRFLAWAHGRGFYHDDCSAEHLLIGPDEGPPQFAFIDIDNGRLFDGPISSRRRMMNLFQVLRSLSRRSLPAESREAFVAGYLAASGLEKQFSIEDCRAAINGIARRKVGRAVI